MQIDLSKTIHVLFFCALLPAVSIGIAWVVHIIIPNPSFLIDTLSPLGAYGILFYLFDRFLWRYSFFRYIGITQYPDLNGRWEGTQISSYKVDGRNVETPSVLEIRQTFTKINVKAFYPQSNSESVAAVFAQFGDDTYLYYTYDNDPTSLKEDDMHFHRGTTKLAYNEKKKCLQGTYYNSRGRTGDMLNFHSDGPELYNSFTK